jgi:hypothetical protein
MCSNISAILNRGEAGVANRRVAGTAMAPEAWR